jgi:hypothetical protein
LKIYLKRFVTYIDSRSALFLHFHRLYTQISLTFPGTIHILFPLELIYCVINSSCYMILTIPTIIYTHEDFFIICLPGLQKYVCPLATGGPTQPPAQWVPGVLSLGVKWVGREADHSPPSSAEVKE